MVISQALAISQLNDLNANYNGGTLAIFSGSAPATVEGAADTGALVSFVFSGTAFATATYTSPYAHAAATFNASSVAPTTSGTAGYAAAFSSAGTPLALYTVGTSGADINFGTLTITTGTNVTMSFTHQQAGS